jgi:hypothetical protein
MPELTQELLIKLLDYNPDTGVFIWKPRAKKHFKTARACKMWNTRFAGKQAGCKSQKGNRTYLVIGIFYVLYHAHTLAWIITTGKKPVYEIDHENGDGLANWFANLRDVPHVENSRNMKLKKSNTSGANGVYWNEERKKHEAYIHVDKKKINLGRYAKKKDAIAAREAADIKYGFHPNHGSRRPL